MASMCRGARSASSITAILVLLVCTCADDDARLSFRADRIAHEIIITDGHIDVPYRLTERWEDVSQRTLHGQFDFPRAREGGLDAPFISIYTPAERETQGTSRSLADSLIDLVESIAAASPDKFAIASSPEQVIENFERGVISFCLGMENGSPIEGKLENLAHFYRRGIRYITLTHSLANHICDSSYDSTRVWNGLSPFGHDVVREMNRLGIMVDISHVSDEAFFDVMDVTPVPVIASHSSCRRFLPGFERNISDEMIRRVRDNGGVVQVNFGSTFLTQEARDWADIFKKRRDAYLAENSFANGSPEAKAFKVSYRKEQPFPYASVADVADHIDHIVEVAGIAHVAFGSDFDGVGDTLPRGLEDVSCYPAVIAELLSRGYSEDDIERVAYRNVFRVWRAVIAAAETP